MSCIFKKMQENIDKLDDILDKANATINEMNLTTDNVKEIAQYRNNLRSQYAELIELSVNIEISKKCNECDIDNCEYRI